MRLKLVPEGTEFDFLRIRRVCLRASAALVVLSAALYLVLGLNYGIDFPRRDHA